MSWLKCKRLGHFVKLAEMVSHVSGKIPHLLLQSTDGFSILLPEQLKHMVQMGKSPVKVTRLSTTTSLCDIAPQFHEDTVLSMVWPKDKRPDLVPFSYHTSESQS